MDGLEAGGVTICWSSPYGFHRSKLRDYRIYQDFGLPESFQFHYAEKDGKRVSAAGMYIFPPEGQSAWDPYPFPRFSDGKFLWSEDPWNQEKPCMCETCRK